MPISQRIGRLLILPLVLLLGFLVFRDPGSADGPVVTGAGPSTTASGADPARPVSVPSTAPSTSDDPSGAPTTSAAAPPSSTAMPNTTTTAVGTTTTAVGGTSIGDLPPSDQSTPPVQPLGTYEGGTLVLKGSVPHEATARAYLRRLERAFGAENIAVQLTRDARVSADTLRIDVAGDFPPPEGTSLDPGLESLVGVSATILDQLPEATLVIAGGGAADPSVSIARARSVVDHLVERGLPPDRVEAARADGSQQVATDDTADGEPADQQITVSFQGITADGI